MSYSVIIPTMGRDTLDRAIQSASKQSYPPAEILVVAGRTPAISDENRKLVRIIDNFSDNSSVKSVARNRNLGIAAAASDIVAFLDDDDTWMANKAEMQMDFLEDFPDAVSIASASYSLNRLVKYRRPRKLIAKNEEILSAHYGKRHFLPSPYYTQIGGAMVSRKLASLSPFDEGLPFCEDIWWFHELQGKGAQLHQHQNVLFSVAGNPFRAAARDSGVGHELWASKLRSVNPEFASNYLRGISFRNALMRGNIYEAISHLR